MLNKTDHDEVICLEYNLPRAERIDKPHSTVPIAVSPRGWSREATRQSPVIDEIQSRCAQLYVLTLNQSKSSAELASLTPPPHLKPELFPGIGLETPLENIDRYFSELWNQAYIDPTNTARIPSSRVRRFLVEPMFISLEPLSNTCSAASGCKRSICPLVWAISRRAH